MRLDDPLRAAQANEGGQRELALPGLDRRTPETVHHELQEWRLDLVAPGRPLPALVEPRPARRSGLDDGVDEPRLDLVLGIDVRQPPVVLLDRPFDRLPRALPVEMLDPHV